jgi:transposase
MKRHSPAAPECLIARQAQRCPGQRSGCTAAWLFAGLQRYGWPVICIDARHAAAALQAGFRNKNDRNDARDIADLMRVNKYRPVWVKSPEVQQQGRLLTARATLQSQLVALENTIRGLLRQQGIGLTDRCTAFEAAVREAIGDDRLLEAAVHPLLGTRNAGLIGRIRYLVRMPGLLCQIPRSKGGDKRVRAREA